MSKKRKTTEEFKKEVLENKNGDGKDFKVLETYIKNDTPITFLYIPYNKTFKMTPNHFLSGRRPYFLKSKIMSRTDEGFKKLVFEKTNGEFTVLGTYKDTYTPIKMRHNCDLCRNHEFFIVPNDFLGSKNRKGQRCPVCSCHDRKPYYYKNVLNKRYNCKNFNFLEVDINNNTTLIRHEDCGKYFSRKLKYVMSNNCLNKNSFLCPYCNSKSRANLITENFLKENNIKYLAEVNFKELPKLRFDFQIFLNSSNSKFILLELDGIQHRKQIKYFDDKLRFEERLKRDIQKDEFAKNKNIPLYRIQLKANFSIKEQEKLINQIKQILGRYKLL